ncbi:hypothetical protein PT974_09919 [Cladobotryum mycophilum]|uniref:Uncharacterized protein n=1 Tax=Cladobotryum mycophilum TaxID=491253 RepID=A0ABR0SHI9_9HYPO
MTLPTPVSDQIVTPTRHTHILEDDMPSTHRMSRYENMNRDDKSEDGSPTNQQTVTPLIAQPNFSDQATVAKPATDADVTDNDSEATNPDARSEILKWYERITRLGSNTSDSVLTPCKSQAPSSGAVGKTVRFTEKPRRECRPTTPCSPYNRDVNDECHIFNTTLSQSNNIIKLNLIEAILLP